MILSTSILGKELKKAPDGTMLMIYELEGGVIVFTRDHVQYEYLTKLLRFDRINIQFDFLSKEGVYENFHIIDPGVGPRCHICGIRQHHRNFTMSKFDMVVPEDATCKKCASGGIEELQCLDCDWKWSEYKKRGKHVDVCPSCGSYNVDEVIPCPYCGRPIASSKVERPVDYCHHD